MEAGITTGFRRNDVICGRPLYSAASRATAGAA